MPLSHPQARHPQPCRALARARAGAATLTAALALAGCGGTAPDPHDARQAARTLRLFLSAVAAGDGETACAYATPAGRMRLAAAAAQRDVPCPRVISVASRHLRPALRRALRTAEIRRVEIHGDRAAVAAGDITSTAGSLDALLGGGGGAPATLRKISGRWLVDG